MLGDMTVRTGTKVSTILDNPPGPPGAPGLGIIITLKLEVELHEAAGGVLCGFLNGRTFEAKFSFETDWHEGSIAVFRTPTQKPGSPAPWAYPGRGYLQNR